MNINSPGLWPRRDRSWTSSFHPLGSLDFFQSSLHPLSPYCFLDLSGAHCEAPRGGSADHVTGVAAWNTLQDIGLKIGLVFDSFFFDVGSILGSKMHPKSTKILWKSDSKLRFDFESFSTPFFVFLFDFRFP